MKKTLVIIIFFIVFLILYFIQANFFSWYNIAGIKPNLFIVFSVFIGLFLGKKVGFATGIFFGLILDLLIGKRIGLNAIMLSIAGMISGILDKSFSKESRIMVMTMTFGITIICETINYALQIILLNADFAFITFTKIIVIEAIYNAIIIIILYPLIQKTGNKIEEIFHDRKNALMRYY